MSQERHQAHAEEQRQYINPDNQELSQERHQAHAQEEEELTWQQRHPGFVQKQRRYRNPGPSGLHANVIANPTDSTEEQVSEETVNEPFEIRILSLNKMEQKLPKHSNDITSNKNMNGR